MATLTLIGEPFPDFEARAHAAAARCLAEAAASTAPRGCSSRLLLARDSEVPALDSARASIEAVPLNASALPLLWRTGATARPLDGELVHASTPMVPLRTRSEDDGSQSTVMVPHALAWRAPELMGSGNAKAYRAFVRRAVKHADVLLAPTHTVAEQIGEIFGIEVQVLPLAAPVEYLPAEDSEHVRDRLGLPERYVATTSLPGEHGRLEWIIEAMLADDSLPDLVVLHLDPEPLPPVREILASRVHIIEVEDLKEVGAVISGALVLALPQTDMGCGFEVLAALEAHVPVLHSGLEVADELALDAAVNAADGDTFVTTLARLCSEEGSNERTRLGLFAEDRKRAFSWHTTAWQLWELHASI